MRILIEEYLYDYEDVKTVLHGLDVLKDVNGKVSLGYVGYYFNPHPDVQDCVFILPKVLLEGKPGEEKIFGHISPKDLINPEKCSELSKDEYSFIYNLSVWIYRVICVFKDHEYDSRRGNKKNSPLDCAPHACSHDGAFSSTQKQYFPRCPAGIAPMEQGQRTFCDVYHKEYTFRFQQD